MAGRVRSDPATATATATIPPGPPASGLQPSHADPAEILELRFGRQLLIRQHRDLGPLVFDQPAQVAADVGARQDDRPGRAAHGATTLTSPLHIGAGATGPGSADGAESNR